VSRPLPRLHALTDARIARLPDLGVRAAAIAAIGPAVALHARDRESSAVALLALAERFAALARAPEAAVFVNARPDIAVLVQAHGIQLGDGDLAPADARRILAHGAIGRSVHAPDEAARARDEGADFVIFGNVFDTATHPERPGTGLEALHAATSHGLPVIAVGGITPERAAEVHAAGAYGIAAIGALWRATDPYAAARRLLAPWAEAA